MPINKGDKDYRRLLHVFDSHSVKLSRIEKNWTEIVQEKAELAKIEDRIVLATDTIKIPKEGKRQVRVKSLSQSSQNVKKPKTKSRLRAFSPEIQIIQIIRNASI